jgi:carbamoyltransferase
MRRLVWVAEKFTLAVQSDPQLAAAVPNPEHPARSSTQLWKDRPLNILGIVTKSHDTGIALLKDGQPHFVLEEERFNRQKHTMDFPSEALEAAFDGSYGVSFKDIDVITTPWDMARLRRTLFWQVAGKMPASLNLLWPSAHKVQSSSIVNLPFRLWAGLGKRYGFSRMPKIVQVGHHESHASVFFVSPYEDATVLVMDGYGDETATTAWDGRGNRIERLWADGFFDSLGMLYTLVTEYIGFKVFEEGTVMALAACGGPTYREKFRDLIRLEPGGRVRINPDYISYDTHGFNKPFKPVFYETFGPPRRRDEPVTDRHRDIAYGLQHVIEDAILHMVRELGKTAPSKNLVLSGGVALNCVANGKILSETDYQSVWVPPVASDSGAPLGSTLYHHHMTLGAKRNFVLTHAFYGKGYTDAEIVRALDDAGLAYTRMDEPALLQRVAQDLADEKIVGWFQGRFEMGPRALGNRSILSGARSNKMKDLINARIKHREAFRPFAPVVLIEKLPEWFEFTQPDPFMTMAPMIRKDKIDQIPAAAHVDGTGRIQTIDRAANPRYYDVIANYEKITGIPVILNTSFNRQEPVVNRPEEAISCYLRTDMDRIVLGDYYVEDRNPAAIARAHERFVQKPSLV